jgi:hypothetical protein
MSDDLKQRLAAAKAARAALQTKAATVSEADELAAEVAAEERALKEEQALAALVEQYGAKKLAKIDTDLGAIILFRSAPAAYNRFAEKSDFKVEDVRQLVMPCIKYPTISEFEEILREQPGTLFVCANALAHLAGARKDALSGK